MTPASIRNNNPGAQYPGKSARKFGSASFETLKSKDGIHKIATFPTSIHGAAAQFDLLSRDYCGMTLENAITRWCGDYYSTTYLKVLKDRTGIDGSTVLTKIMLADHDVAIPIAKAMAWQEAGQDYPLDDAGWLQAHQMAMGSETSAPAWNPRNDVPSPKPETRRANVVRKVVKVGQVVTGSVAAGGAAVSQMQTPAIPKVPPGVTDTLTNLGGWAKLLPAGQTGMLVVGALVFATIACAAMLAGKLRS